MLWKVLIFKNFFFYTKSHNAPLPNLVARSLVWLSELAIGVDGPIAGASGSNIYKWPYLAYVWMIKCI